MTNYTEAVAHYQQLLSLGANEDQAVRDTQVAFELTDQEADTLIDPMAYYNRAADMDAEFYAVN